MLIVLASSRLYIVQAITGDDDGDKRGRCSNFGRKNSSVGHVKFYVTKLLLHATCYNFFINNVFRR